MEQRPPKGDEDHVARHASARWDPVIAAYQQYARDRRDKNRVEALRQAGAETGFDATITHSFRSACRGQRPEFEVSQALHALESPKRLDLLRAWFELCVPTRSLSYPTQGRIAQDSELAGLGISIGSVQRTGDNHVFSRVLPHHERLLQDKRFEVMSPLSGRALVSNASLLHIAGHGRPMIAFHFVDEGEPFFVFLNTFTGCRSGLFFPERDLMVSAPAEAPRAIAMFRALVTEFASETAAHLIHKGRRPLALLIGSMDHFGHSVLNEYEAYHQCIGAGLFATVDVVLRGWANFAPHTELFPELVEKPVLQVDSAVAGYLTVVEGRYLVTRPMCNNRFSLGLGERLRAAARRHMVAEPSSDLVRAERRWPLLWIEIRSHDRRWLDQEEQLPQLIDTLAARFPDLGLILGGWSRMIERRESDEKMVESDRAVALNIMERVKSKIQVFDITGVVTLEKMAWAMACDLFVSTFGTGLIFPCFVGRRPGVMHTNSVYADLFTQVARNDPQAVVTLKSLRERPVDFRLVVPEKMVDHALQIRMIDPVHIVDADPGQPNGVRSHYLEWRPVYDEVLAILRDLPSRTAVGRKRIDEPGAR